MRTTVQINGKGKNEPYVPFFPLGGFSPLQSAALTSVAVRQRSTPMSVALAQLLRRSPNVLLIPGTSSAAHLRENAAGAGLPLSDDDVAELDKIGRQRRFRRLWQAGGRRLRGRGQRCGHRPRSGA